jgi:tetratricopeptide (TPR) repeat protein
MGKTKQFRGRDAKKARKAARHAEFNSSIPQTSSNPPELLARAAAQLQVGDPEGALPLAQKAETLLKSKQPPTNLLPALSLLGEIYVECGDPESAVATFQRAVEIDPDGQVPETDGGGAEKFFWLAQLSENGGRESIEGYERGIAVLERLIAADAGKPGLENEQDERRKKQASALCSMIEVWMTDLS